MIYTDATRLPRLMQCLGSHHMPAPLPGDDDPQARDEGNAAHYMAQQVFNGANIWALIGTRAYNGHIMDEEMARHVQTYLGALDCGQMEVDTSHGPVAGRADHISWRCHPNDQHQMPQSLTVDDFKYGYRLVEPEMNWTLISHAIGWCVHNNAQPQKITLRIHQPRRHHPLGPMREWSFNYVELTNFAQQIYARLGSNDNSLHTGSHCAKCHAASVCPAYREANMNAIDATTKFFSDTLAPEQLATELDLVRQAESVIEGRLKALEELARHRIMAGEAIPNYMIDLSYANRRFKSAFTPSAITALTGKSATVEKTCTPAELERRGVDPKIIEFMTERPVAARKLVRIDVDAKARKMLRKD